MTSRTSYFLLAGLSIIASLSAQSYHHLLPTGQYQHEIYFEDAASFPASTIPAISGGAFQESATPLFQVRPPSPFAVDLFTPNTVQQPAETPGQIENYMKALEEEAREADKEQNRIAATGGFRFGGGLLFNGGGDGPSSYVDVKVNGPKDFKYSYAV